MTDHCKTNTLFGRWTTSAKKKENFVENDEDEKILHVERSRIVVLNIINVRPNKSKIMIPCLFRVIVIFTKSYNKSCMTENKIASKLGNTKENKKK